MARDYVIKGTSTTLRLALVSCANAAEAARLAWRVTSPQATALLSKGLASASLLASFLKGEERVQLHWLCASAQAGAAVSEVYAEAMPIGEVRGYIRGSGLEAGAGAWDGRLPTAGGDGAFTVSRVLYGARTQHRSTVALAKGDIESELLHYYAQSEQRAAQVRLDAAVDGTGRVTQCTGMLLEALSQEGGLPSSGQAEPEGSSFEALAARLGGSASPWPPGATAPQAAAAIAPALQWGKRVPLDFFCRCSLVGFRDKLVGSCSQELLRQMVDEATGGVAATLVCSFCNRSHEVMSKDLQQALAV